jgi:colicin import membrane protein
MSTRRSLSLLAALLATALAVIAADDDASQRQRIERERAAVDARAHAGETACAARFAVSSCLEQVRAERRAATQQLDHQRALLDDAQRKRKAAERQARIQERQGAQAKADDLRVAPAVEQTPRTAAGRATAPASGSAAAAAPDGAKRRAAAAQEQDQVARRAAASKERARAAALHRDVVERRNHERAARRAPAPPLPTPAASAPTQR